MTTETDREPARRRLFKVVYDVQAATPHSIEEIESIAATALRRGWDDVERVALFARAVAGWTTCDPGYPATIEALLQRASASRDHVMVALALGLRAQVDPGDDDVLAEQRDADLARAAVMLERTEGSVLERISAHTACGMAFSARSLFELGDEQYELAAAIGASARSELSAVQERSDELAALDAVLAPVSFHRAAVQVAWACALRQLRDEPGVRTRRAAWYELAATWPTTDMPSLWQVELEVLRLLLAATAGYDVADQAEELVADLEPSGAVGRRHIGLARLAIAISDADAGRLLASSVESAVGGLDPTSHPQAYDLALLLAVELEATSGVTAGLRYARCQLEQNWRNRMGRLGAMRSRMEAQRLSRERDLLSRYANLDDLTGIGNRRALDAYISDSLRAGIGQIALVMMDVDGFKGVNDRFGHGVGDDVLRAIARVLERYVRSVDVVVRLGGDEFAIVLANAAPDAATSRAQAMLEQLATTSWDGIAPGLDVHASAGVAAGSPYDLDAVRAAADRRLYAAKAAGGHKVVSRS